MIRFKKTKGNRSVILTVLLLLLLMIFSRRNPEQSRLPSAILNTIISPVNGIFYSASEALQDLYERTVGSRSIPAENDRLQLENDALRDEILRLEAVVNEQEFLKNEYELRKQSFKNAISAVITMEDPSNAFKQFVLNRGALDGVQVGDFVVEGVRDTKNQVVRGLVGQVKQVGPNASTVSSVLDQSSNISILFQTSGAYGILNRRDGEQFYGYLLDATDAVQLDEPVVTSGIGGRYPRGLYLGTVSEVNLAQDGLTKNVTIKPAVDFGRLYRVLVVHPEEAAVQGLPAANQTEKEPQSMEKKEATNE